jgi:hypothetical protein
MTVIALSAALGAATLTLGAKKAAPPEPGTAPRPTLQLQASTRNGFLPLHVTLYGRLEGVSRDEVRFCHAGVEWVGQTGAGQVMRSTEDTKCLHPAGETTIEHAYQKSLVLENEGIFRYQLILHLNNGEKVRSNTIDIRVMSNH